MSNGLTGSDGVYQLWVKNVATGIETEIVNYNGPTTPTAGGGTDKFGFYH